MILRRNWCPVRKARGWSPRTWWYP